jgi:LysR family transcriptional regulator, nitrogen assimilation regulatory protein
MVELRTLAYFAVACRSESLAAAARELGIAVSTLSATLKSLEQDLGLTLFRRLNGGLIPTAATRMLMRAADSLLVAERFACRWAVLPAKTRLKVLTVDIGLSFTIGGMSHAIRRAIESFGAERQEVLVEAVWTDEKDLPHIDGIAEHLTDCDRSQIAIALAPELRRDLKHATILLRDQWVFACRLPAGTHDRPTPGELASGRLVVPMLSSSLIEQADRYFSQNGINGVRFLADHPGDLPRLIELYPDAALFIPESLMSRRLGLLNVGAIAPEKSLSMNIVARVPKPNAITALFLRHLRRALAHPDGARFQRPAITLRQIHYFRMVQRLRRVSAAARAVNVSQPALSEQLHKLEALLGGALFERRGDGVIPTIRGDRFSRIAPLIEGKARRLSNDATVAAPPPGRRIAIGILPSVNQHGFLLNRVTEALLDIQLRHPTLKLVIQEAPNRTLQDWIMRGLIGIAVVETGVPHMPRLPLSCSEGLAAVAHTRHKLLPPGPVTLADLARFKLVLPTTRFGLRQLFDDAAGERGIKISPHLEIDALSMAVAMLARLPVCTVLPPSAVEREIASGDLTAHPIVEPEVSRRLYVIYSGERTLTQSERDLVNTLRKKLSDTRNVG